MNSVVINNQELEVLKLTPYAYMGGKGEKTLQIKVSSEVAGFDVLKELFDGATDTLKYYEEDTLVCEYDGYSNFECRYLDGVFNIELKKGTLVDQVNALLTANERLNMALNALDEANGKASATIAMLEEQNAMLEACILELSEIIYA